MTELLCDGVVDEIGKNSNVGSDSSDSDSVELMTPLTTPIIDFHLIISAFTTPNLTPFPERLN